MANCKLALNRANITKAVVITGGAVSIAASVVASINKASRPVQVGLLGLNTALLVAGTVVAKNTASAMYDKPKAQSKGRPGSFVVRHPILSTLIPIVGRVSAWNLSNEAQLKCVVS